jgi:hypothetical protein
MHVEVGHLKRADIDQRMALLLNPTLGGFSRELGPDFFPTITPNAVWHIHIPNGICGAAVKKNLRVHSVLLLSAKVAERFPAAVDFTKQRAAFFDRQLVPYLPDISAGIAGFRVFECHAADLG